MRQMMNRIRELIRSAPGSLKDWLLLNISRYEGHRYAFEIHQYT